MLAWRNASKHEDLQVIWQIAVRCSTYPKLGKRSALYNVRYTFEKPRRRQSSGRAPVSVIKRKSSIVEMRFRGLVNNTGQRVTLFAFLGWLASIYRAVRL